MSAYERTHWRDEWLSERHKNWGSNCPGVDIDWFFIEYDLAEPVALVDYKRWAFRGFPPSPDSTSASIRAFSRLSERSGVPGMVVYYQQPDPIGFCVYPLNRAAKQFFDEGQSLSELEWVEKLYGIRRRVFETKIMAKMSVKRPSWESRAA